MPRNSYRNVAPTKPVVGKDQPLGVIIAAAGSGKKTRTFGATSLVMTGNGQTLIARQLAVIRHVYPASDIVAVVGYEADRVIKNLPPGIRIAENERFEDTNIVRSLAIGMRVLDRDKIMFIHGDVLFNCEAIEHLTEIPSIGADTKDQFKADEIGIANNGTLVTNLAYGMDTKWGQIAYLAGRELKLFREFIFDRNKATNYAFEALNYVIEQGGILHMIENEGSMYLEIDSFRDIERANLQ